jgi:hypothetical protein
VIAKRYEAKSTSSTTNKPFDEWGHVFYDLHLASAILDRFVHHCSFVVIDGPSYRMRDRLGEQLGRKAGRPKRESAQETTNPHVMEPVQEKEGVDYNV